MTTTINNEHKKLNFSSEREQSQACLNSAEHEKNQGRKVLNVPNLRFPEFQGEWEKCTFDEIAQYKKGPFGSALKKDLFVPQSENAIKVYEQQNAIKKDWTLSRYYITKDYFNAHMKQFVAKAGDLIVSCAGTIGEVYELPKDAEEGVFNQALMRVRVNDEVVNKEIFITVFSSMIDKFSKIYSNGSAIKNIPPFADLKRTQVYLPCKEEQIVIAQLLRSLDERITTQNKIIDKLQSLIKGIGKQLFMDNQNWRTVKIGELLRIGNGKDYKHLSIGKIPVYGTGGQMLLVNDYLYDGESVCIGRKGTIDTPMFLKGKFWTVDTLFYTYDFKDVLPKFCYYLFLQINWKLYNEGTGVPSLSKSTIENIKVKIPSLEQQQKICSILDCYEHKTNNEEQILELYHSEKQYLLRQMFI